MSEFGFFLNILRKNKQIETKFCIHIIIDKILVGIVDSCFSQIYNRCNGSQVSDRCPLGYLFVLWIPLYAVRKHDVM